MSAPKLTHTARGTIAVTESRRGGSWTVVVVRPCQHTQGAARSFPWENAAKDHGLVMLDDECKREECKP